MTTLWMDVAWRRGAFALQAALRARPDEVTALLGPSGSGKSSLLRLAAGLARPDEGRIGLGEKLWLDRAAGVFVPPQRRGVGMVFQDYALFSHRSVAANVGFGVARRRRRVQVAVWLRRLGLAHLADRLPHQLSGGERQRVALARALAMEPQVLLLDEPFSAVDPRLRQALRELLAEVLAETGRPTLLVSHDLDDVRYLADTVGVMVAGRLHCLGPRAAVFDDPGTREAAEVLGWRNFLPVEGVAGCEVVGPWGRLRLPEPVPADVAWLGVRGERLRLGSPRGEGLKGRVLRITDLGAVRELSCRLDCGLMLHVRRPWDEPLPVAGSEVGIQLPLPALRPLRVKVGGRPHRPCSVVGEWQAEGR